MEVGNISDVSLFSSLILENATQGQGGSRIEVMYNIQFAVQAEVTKKFLFHISSSQKNSRIEHTETSKY